MTHLILPHGGTLTGRHMPISDADKPLLRDSLSWNLTPRQVNDLELLANGGFSPLDGFMGEADYESVLVGMRLANGLLWPIPVTLDVTVDFAAQVAIGDHIVLCDREGVPAALMKVSAKWVPDKRREALAVFGTDDRDHPGVGHLLDMTNPVYLGGPIRALATPLHYDFRDLRKSPEELRARFAELGWRRVMALPTRRPIHRLQVVLTLRAVQKAEGNLLIHSIIGAGFPGDVDHFTRVRCHEHILKRYPEKTALLALLPLAPRLAGPREALWQAIVAKNHGCTHLMIDDGGRNEEEQGACDTKVGRELLAEHAAEIGVIPVAFGATAYSPGRAAFVAEKDRAKDEITLELSDADLLSRLQHDREIPDWFSFPEVLAELRRAYPPNYRRGFTVFFTGLSGAGKSTIANALMIKLMARGARRVTLLDGDVVRRHLSSELGFSREHRDLNILRIGFVASEITKNGGVAICAPIAPYAETRRKVREMVQAVGGFVEVHVATPIDVCEKRDRKGLYARARAGLVKGFTGIDDPYEIPEHAELRIDGTSVMPDEAAQRIILKLENMGYVRATEL